MLYNRSPSLSHLKTFGCLYYAIVVSPKQKFDSHARQCIFIGYPLNKKGYKLFDIDAGTFFTSRDVTFHESVLPFFQQSWMESSPPLQEILLAIDIDLRTPAQHSLDPLSSLTRHNAPERPADQPFSPTPESITPITEPSLNRPSCSTIQLHNNPTFLPSRLRNEIPSQSFDHYPRPVEWNQVSYASFSF